MKMTNDVLATARALSDQDLLARLDLLANRERGASAELVAHLAALDTRPSLLAGKGYASLFAYCTQALRLSEDAACNRIETARACRPFPGIIDLLAAGDLSLTTVRMIRRHLTPENHASVLARARGRSRREIEVLVAELSPRPDVPTSVRKLPASARRLSAPPALAATVPGPAPTPAASVPVGPAPPVFAPTPRPIIEATAPERYRVQFTVGPETHDKLRRLQDLLRREIPNGDPAAIFDRGLTLLLEKAEREKLGIGAKPRKGSIRPGTDRTRRPEAAVRSAAWERDGGRCGFVSEGGRRCTERVFLEFHHLHAYAQGGKRTLENIRLRCRRHNQYEAELVFGPRDASIVREGQGFVQSG